MSQQYYYNPFGNSSDVNSVRDAYFLSEQKKKEQKREIRAISLTMSCAIIAYLAIQMIFSTVLEVIPELNALYQESMMVKYAFNILIISVGAVALPFGVMALINRKKYAGPVIPNQSVGAADGTAWVCFGVFVCVVANFIVGYISLISQSVFGYELKGADVDALPDSLFACVMQLIALAVVPAICEELAMRCCSLQLLNKFGKGFSIFAVSIVFGLLHGNIIQFMFAFVVGLILGYVTVQTNNIMPAIFIHFLNNGVSVVQNIVKAYSSEKTAESAVLIIYAFFAVTGLASLIYLAAKNKLRMVKGEKEDVLSNSAKFSAFLFPWMIVPFFLLILLTATTIVKV